LAILWRETEGDPTLRARAFAGLRRFQQALRQTSARACTIFAQHGRAQLLQIEADPVKLLGRSPVLFVPSLINPPHVLDLAPGNSLLRHLASEGHPVFQIDWGTPGPDDSGQDIAGHVTEMLLPLMGRLPAPPILVGYCLGGTIAIAAASLAPCQAIATIAAPWHFDAYPDEFRQQTSNAWNASRTVCERLGVMPMEVLQAGFWSLDPERTIAKYADFADMAEDDPGYDAFLLLEDWVNEGAPLTFAAGRELIEQFYGRNVTASGDWRVDGKVIDPAALTVPSFAISSTTDKLVPEGATPPADEWLSLDLGHVGMVVGRRAPEILWKPLSAWLTAQGG
jgi:polyhydroxyalkanoate synthase